MEIIQYSMK